VKTVLTRCGIGESELLWVIDDKGSFLFGPPSDAAPPLAPAKRDCLMKWVDEKDVRAGQLGHGAAQ
jgi:hypothetical protein